MQPHEIKPNTQLCTIMGYNAQTGKSRQYFNKILKDNGINATAIALNISDDHFAFTMQNLAKSKVERVIVEYEFGVDALKYCDESNSNQSIDCVEVVEGKIIGINLDTKLDELMDTSMLDKQAKLALKMMIIASRWYGAPIEIDNIPLMLG